MSSRRSEPTFVSELGYWSVKLKTGLVVTLRAHAYGQENGSYVFVALMKGSPNYEYELIRIPEAAVEVIDGG